MRPAISIGYLLLLLSCAKQTTPTGGPKDETPPQLLRSVPANRQTGFNRNQVELLFNEYVQVNNVREQIVIVPTVGKKFEVVARKNKVTLKFNSKLLDSTTYTINFREAIQDLTEKNAAKNLKLAFSTGPYVDSLSIEGSVHDLLKGTASENYTVAIAPLTDTFSIFIHTPQFFTLTDKKGGFSIENVKRGTYRLYAFQDVNKNLKVDSRSEPFGFLADTIYLNKSVKNISLYSIMLDMRPIKLISAKPVGNHFLLRFNKGYEACKIEGMLPDFSVQYDNPDFSSIRFFNTLAGLDSLPVRLAITDSIANTMDTVFYLAFNKLNLQKEKFGIKGQKFSYIESKQHIKGELLFTKPVSRVTYDSIFIQLDSLTKVFFKESDFTWNQTRTIAHFTKQLPKPFDPTKPVVSRNTSRQSERGSDIRRTGEKPRPVTKPSETIAFNQLTLAAGAFQSVEADSSVFMSMPFSVVKPETSATLLIDVQGAGNTITQVLDANYQVIAQSSSKKMRFENLQPAEYLVRVILDKNNNGKWDPGNYYLNQPPEHVLFYSDDTGNKKINLKANWEVGPLLIRY